MSSMKSVLTLLNKVAVGKNQSYYQYAIHRLKADSMFE